MNRILIVTGGIACGKSTFVEAAREAGYDIVDADDWYHDIHTKSTEFSMNKQMLFGSLSLKTVAFRHKNWITFERLVAKAFCGYVLINKPRIVVIPEFYRHEMLFKRYLGFANDVVTIERLNNFNEALARDVDRPVELTRKIMENQTPSIVRVDRSDYVLYNEGSRDEFKLECQQWLKSHLPVASTHRMRDIFTWSGKLPSFWPWKSSSS